MQLTFNGSQTLSRITSGDSHIIDLRKQEKLKVLAAPVVDVPGWDLISDHS
jgi:hypothetical protein